MKLKKFAGFSLMEMMVVLLIVAVVMAASAPLISRKMIRTSGAGGTGDSFWTRLGMTNIAYNWGGANNQTVVIGTDSVSSNQPRLQITSTGNPHIELQNGSSNIRMFLNNNAFGITNNTLGSKATAVGASSNAGGTNSTAVGASSKANTTDTTAYGYNAQATALNTTAIGSGASASTARATAIGASSTANAENATAVGTNANALGKNSTAYGYNATASGNDTVAMGTDVTTGTSRSVAIGSGIQAATNTVAIGSVVGRGATFPLVTSALDDAIKYAMSVAVGYYVNAEEGGVAMGVSAQAENQGAIAIGINTRAKNLASIAMGRSTVAEERQSIAIGHNSHAKSKAATAIGTRAYANGNYALAIGGGYFEESGSSGWGSDVVMPANDMTQTTLENETPKFTFYPKGDKLAFLKNSFASSGRASWFGLCNPAYAASGSYYTSVANSAGAISIGSAVNASSNRAIAIGTKVDATAANAIAIGASSNASGTGSIAIGCKVGNYEHYANQIHAIAIGSASIAGGHHAIALGPNAHAAKNYSVAVGLNAEANTTAVAIGKSASAGGTSSIALGTNATASHTRSVAIGYNAATTAANQIVLGDANTTVNIPGNIVWKDKIITFGDTAITQEGHRGRYVQSWESSVNPHPSDRRLKNVGEVFKGGLAELKKLEFFHYTYKEDKSKTPHVGVIAQDLQKVFPDAVIKGDDGFLRIRLEDMFYAVINAVKELDTRLTALSTQVKSNVDLTAKLQQKINTQEKQIAELKKQNAEFEKRLAKLEKKTK